MSVCSCAENFTVGTLEIVERRCEEIPAQQNPVKVE